MRVAEPVLAPWKAALSLEFDFKNGRTRLSERRFEGPLAVQKPLYPEGDAVCHTIVVHPPGGIAGGDQLKVQSKVAAGAHVLLTTPGAGKWYRSCGPWAKQSLAFEAGGILEWLPRETIVFDSAHASLECNINLKDEGRYIGWEIVCLGRSGSGERFGKGEVRIATRVARDGGLLFFERGRIEGSGRVMHSPAGLGGRTVFATLLAAGDLQPALLSDCRRQMPECVAATLLPGLLVARYLGDSTEQAMTCFTALWSLLRPAIAGREAVAPRIWCT